MWEQPDERIEYDRGFMDGWLAALRLQDGMRKP